jgi:hypothetical protein
MPKREDAYRRERLCTFYFQGQLVYVYPQLDFCVRKGNYIAPFSRVETQPSIAPAPQLPSADTPHTEARYIFLRTNVIALFFVQYLPWEGGGGGPDCFETEVKGDSTSRYERGPSLFGSLDSSCRCN